MILLPKRVADWLGLTHPPLKPGFSRTDFGTRGPMCDICGAKVDWNAQEKHSTWHKDRPSDESTTTVSSS